jgi:hypothetical protein
VKNALEAAASGVHLFCWAVSVWSCMNTAQ